MRLFAIFLILNIQLTHIFAYPPNPPQLSSQDNHDPKGYECGDVFFTYTEVKEALLTAQSYLDKGYQYPQKYQGRLYFESNLEEYFLYPIRKGSLYIPHTKAIRTVFRVVFTRNSDEAVDVVAKITNGDYTKCIQRGSANIGPSHSVQGVPNGYLCGHEFITDELISQSLALAQREVRGKSKYLRPHITHLYPEHTGHLLWPIMQENNLYPYREDRIGSYQLILNKERKIVDVVVKGFNKNFLKCVRSRKPPKAPASDKYSKLFVSPPRYGYVCGKKIFNYAVLEESAKTLKNQAAKAMKSSFLREYFGPPCNQPCLIWPILQSGKLFKAGIEGPYRLVLTTDYKIISVVMYVDGIYKDCDKNKILATKNHDTSSYHCRKQLFSHQQLVRAADQACVRMNTLARYSYPANYEGPEFEKEGPYLTYPVFGTGLFKSNAGYHRVVINMSCEVVGALTTLRIDFSKRLVKCHRLDDGPLPPDFFGAKAQTVLEFKLNKSI